MNGRVLKAYSKPSGYFAAEYEIMRYDGVLSQSDIQALADRIYSDRRAAIPSS